MVFMATILPCLRLSMPVVHGMPELRRGDPYSDSGDCVQPKVMPIVLCSIGRWSLEQIVDAYDIPEMSASAASRN
jgi:hypothetical protein